MYVCMYVCVYIYIYTYTQYLLGLYCPLGCLFFCSVYIFYNVLTAPCALCRSPGYTVIYYDILCIIYCNLL